MPEQFGKAYDWLYERLALPKAHELRLTHFDVCLWVRLDRYASGEEGRAWPHQKTLAKDLGCTDRAVRQSLERMARQGIVEILWRSHGRGNVYVPRSPDRNDGSAHGGAGDRNGGSAQPVTGTAVPVVRGTTVPSQRNDGSGHGGAYCSSEQTKEETRGSEAHASAREPAPPPPAPKGLAKAPPSARPKPVAVVDLDTAQRRLKQLVEDALREVVWPLPPADRQPIYEAATWLWEVVKADPSTFEARAMAMVTAWSAEDYVRTKLRGAFGKNFRDHVHRLHEAAIGRGAHGTRRGASIPIQSLDEWEVEAAAVAAARARGRSS